MAIDVGRCSSTAEEGTSVTSEYGHVAFLVIVESRIKCWLAVVLKAPYDLGLADAVAFRSVDDRQHRNIAACNANSNTKVRAILDSRDDLT